ncbi:LuxR C-terminal-related transcriptional regulator [Nonomuraea sp. NPDC049607]|uniref:LuxR C-terminal-related transcriptional regulator n=1 Tax=Nonomuraea sp. NPDC049607 TaxID=3154732 RepID=UPI00344362A4
MTLEALGLGPAEEELYELLVECSPASLDRLAAGFAGPGLPALLSGLESKGLINRLPDEPPRYVAVAPDVALDALLTVAEEGLARARERAADLDDAFQQRASGQQQPLVVEVITGAAAVRQRLHQLQRAARHQVRTFSQPPYFDRHASVAAHRELLERGITSRVIYERDFIDRPGALRLIEEMIGAGQLARVLPSLPMKLYLVDDRFALLVLRYESPDSAALLVHPSGLLEALSRLFEGTWERALPMRLTGSREAPQDDERLIALLLTGLTDEAIARQLGIGYRTAQRRIAELMTRLGAHTRFQAGVQAARSQARSTPEDPRGAPRASGA